LIGSLPRGSVEVVTVATPPDTVGVPSVVDPLVNVTVPVTLAGRVSVKVTEAPGRDGLIEDVSVDAGVALVTSWVVVPAAGL
jgi:VanZ family protein